MLYDCLPGEAGGRGKGGGGEAGEVKGGGGAPMEVWGGEQAGGVQGRGEAGSEGKNNQNQYKCDNNKIFHNLDANFSISKRYLNF